MACCLLHLMALWYHRGRRKWTTPMAVCVVFKSIQNRHLLFKAGADFCYPIMRLNFWRKWRKAGVNPLLRIQKIKQFQGFAVSLSTCRPFICWNLVQSGWKNCSATLAGLRNYPMNAACFVLIRTWLTATSRSLPRAWCKFWCKIVRGVVLQIHGNLLKCFFCGIIVTMRIDIKCNAGIGVPHEVL